MTHDARFSIIPGWIVTDPRLAGIDLQVLCLLGRHTDKQGWCFRSQVKMAGQLGRARSTVQASLDRLIDIGVLEKHVQDTKDGRDTAHCYRVIYDRAPPSGYAFDAYQDADSEENGPIDGGSIVPTPAGIPAPPAGLALAPTAVSSPAPINDPSLTTQTEQEREGAGAAFEDPKKIERKFKAWYPTWPAYLSSSEEAARKAFRALSPEERAECIAKTPAFVAAVKSTRHPKFTFAAVYLNEKAWQRLEDPKDEIGPSTLHNAFSRPWMGLLLAEVSKPMATAWPALTVTLRKIAAESAEKARQIETERRAKYGWPKAAVMASEQKSMAVPALVVGLSEGFQSVPRDSRLARAWQAMFERHGWPWPEGDFKWLQLPAGEPEQAMAEFQKQLSEGKGDADAA